uniref:Reverse transcriptase/retrotransposon-derived protein RNase H-like domain-containing protein n=1 Tax=Maylandia zebra TaxID=106582 RepID=A0A3P9BPN9_9CICH
MVNYCRQWIPDCSFHDHILRECCKKDKLPRILWSTEMTASFNALQGALTSAPCLGLPDYHLPFHLYVTENGTTCTGVLAQEHGSGYRPVAFYSKVLPAVVQGMPACLRAVAACSIMIRDLKQCTSRLCAFCIYLVYCYYNGCTWQALHSLTGLMWM